MRFLWAFRCNPLRGVARRRLCLRRVRSKRPRLRVCHHVQRYALYASLSLLTVAPRVFPVWGKAPYTYFTSST
ncbi:MAG: hypothetical protein LBK44_05805 [Spirochaetales bacterium]|nr:hypothetical protein [Spirochaetales bacterium]